MHLGSMRWLRGQHMLIATQPELRNRNTSVLKRSFHLPKIFAVCKRRDCRGSALGTHRPGANATRLPEVKVCESCGADMPTQAGDRSPVSVSALW